MQGAIQVLSFTFQLYSRRCRVVSASRLHLNPDKTVIMWLGSKHQVGKVTTHDISVLQWSTTTVNTARDLRVMLDSQLTISAQVGAACRSSSAPPCSSSAVGRSKEDSSPRICVFALRLLQLSVVRCYRQPRSTSSSCSKGCPTSRHLHSPIRAHHASIETTSLATSTATY